MHRGGRNKRRGDDNKRRGDDNKGRNGSRGKKPRLDRKGTEADLKKNNDEVAAVEKRLGALRKTVAEHEATLADVKKAVEDNTAAAAALVRTHPDERKALCKETADARKQLGERVCAVVAKLFPNDASIEAAQGELRLKGPIDVAASLYKVCFVLSCLSSSPHDNNTYKKIPPYRSSLPVPTI